MNPNLLLDPLLCEIVEAHRRELLETARAPQPVNGENDGIGASDSVASPERRRLPPPLQLSAAEEGLHRSEWNARVATCRNPTQSAVRTTAVMLIRISGAPT